MKAIRFAHSFKRYRWFLVALACAPACASVLGIEELHEGSPPEGGALDDAGSGAGGSSSGGAMAAGHAGTLAMAGGAAGAAAGMGGMSDADGASDAGGTSDTGSMVMRDGSVESGASGDVVGTLIDYWRHPVANAPLALGTQTTTTGSDGKFRFANVAPTYDITIALSKTTTGRSYNQGWLYQGLTRRDPTLQVYVGVADPAASDEATLDDTITGPTFPLSQDQSLKLAFGSPEGTLEIEQDTQALEYISVEWHILSRTQGTLHALFWTHSGTSTDDPPTAYLGYDSLPVAFATGMTTSAALDLRKTSTISSGPVSGTVAGSSSTDRVNEAYVVWSSGAVMKVASVSPTSAAFSFTMPKLAQASTTVVASRGTFNTTAFAVAHVDDIAPGTTGVNVTIPDPVSLTSPLDGATSIGDTTEFAWGNPGKVSLVRFVFDPVVYYVVTAANKATFPKFAVAGLELPSAAHGTWTVEVQGPFATMDAATGPNGMLDPYALYGSFASAPHGSGSATWSEQRGLTTK